MSDIRLCSIDDCRKAALVKELCNPHYRRLLKYGDPLGGRTPDGKALDFLENEVLTYAGDDCLIWPFTRQTQGYALLWHEGRNVRVNRLVCEHIHGPPPTTKHDAAHNCGHEGCVNPQHIRWATRRENCADKIAHGTLACGERQGQSKLTEADIREIRKLFGTMPQNAIATRFGVSPNTICRIKSGKIWRSDPQGSGRRG